MDRWVNADQVVGNTARPEARDGVEDGGCGLSGVDGAASRVHGSDVGVVGSQPVPGGFRGAPAGVDQVPGPVPLASSGGFPRHGSRVSCRSKGAVADPAVFVRIDRDGQHRRRGEETR